MEALLDARRRYVRLRDALSLTSPLDSYLRTEIDQTIQVLERKLSEVQAPPQSEVQQ